MNRHSIQARVLLLQGAGWVASLTLIAGTGWLTVEEVRRQTRTARAQMAEVVAGTLDRTVAADLSRVQRLSSTYDLGPEDGAALRVVLRQIHQHATLVDTLTIVAADGRVLAQEPATRPATTVTLDDVATVMASGQPSVRTTPDGADSVDVLVPLRDRHGAPAAVAVARLSMAARQVRDLLASSEASLVRSPAVDGSQVTRPLTLLPWAVTLSAGLPESEVTLAAIRNTLLWLGPLLIALGALFAWGTAWSVRQPVLQLTAATERMRAGDLTTPIAALPDDEVGRLGQGLEHLRSALRDSLATIARHNDELERRIAERTRELEQVCRRLSDRDAWRAQVLRRVISAQEDERRRLARELHDDTCQSLAALAVSAEAALDGLPDGQARERLIAVKALVDRSLADLHRVIYDLRPSVLDDLGLVPAVRWLIARRFDRSPVNVRLEVDGDDDLGACLAPDVTTALFRVVQEALTNVERHARAENVLVQISPKDGLLSIEIEDDGQGFKSEEAVGPVGDGRGLGLLGMRERVELIGGSCLVESAPGRGTRVIVTVPHGQAGAKEA
jgi:signal transduction histidine kinase